MKKIESPFFDLFHLGGERQVTGSCHLLKIRSGPSIMIDCGLSQGNDPHVRMSRMPVAPKDLDYLFLTHAHLDHAGRVPRLIEKGFSGEIICAHATRALIMPMLKDAMSISGMNDRRMASREAELDELSWGFEYNETFSLKKGVSFKLKNAGHILGSCFVRFEIPAEAGKTVSIVFSGDLGLKDTPLLPDPDPPDASDFLVMESTYGDRLHTSRKDRIQRLGALMEKALRDKGKIFIPAFSLGRTQELIFEMDRLFSDPDLGRAFPGLRNKRIPVFVDSPLGIGITKIYSSLKEFWDAEAKAALYSGDHPLDFKDLFAVESHSHHKRLLDIPGPAVIIAGSGMCSGGRILNHLENGLGHPANDVFFVGYQARHTTGRRILKNRKRRNGHVFINGARVPVRAGVYRMGAYSAHADQKGLVDWAMSMPGKPRLIKLIHGEPRAQSVLKRIFESNGYPVSD
ncbi:Metallo-beta-lactamase family protein [Candidatus Desulfarcum epimagneticum]|uniref:Metallo-beta-lactamase family protein n=1 Tax=uncultured Desulfobacteraceae bacterium TaxID=218296 RepID=A0A484HDV4_9BACT|nr:Metallo-beta-lactamase family protein [uncultured Desulfobacteraceae bacterium]